MFKYIAEVLNWYFRVTYNIFCVSPIRFICDLFGSMTASVFQLVFFLLPIKALIIVSGENLPGYLKNIPYVSPTRESWILVMCAAIVVVFALNLALSKYLKFSTSRYTEKFARAQRKGGWSDLDLVAIVYKRLLDSYGNLGLILLFFTGIYFAYFGFFLFSICSFLGICLGIFLVALISSGFRMHMQQNAVLFFNGAPTLLFLFAFCFVAADQLWGATRTDVFLIIVSLLLYRQASVVLAQNTVGIFWFDQNRYRVQNLFHQSEHNFSGSPKETTVWNFLEKKEIFFREVLEAVGVPDPTVISAEWIDIPLPFLHVVKVEAKSETKSESQVYLLKVFEKHQARLSRKEQILYPLLKAGNVVPEIVGCFEFQMGDVHVFKIGKSTQFGNFNVAAEDVYSKIFSLKIPGDFVEEFKAQHKLLSERLWMVLKRLDVAADVGQRLVLQEFYARLSKIDFKVRDMPLVLVLPSGQIANAVMSEGGDHKLFFAGDWVLEPAGFDMPANNALKKSWSSGIGKLNQSDVGGNFDAMLELISSLAQIENYCKQGRLNAAIDLVKTLLVDDLFLSLSLESSSLDVSEVQVS